MLAIFRLHPFNYSTLYHICGKFRKACAYPFSSQYGSDAVFFISFFCFQHTHMALKFFIMYVGRLVVSLTDALMVHSTLLGCWAQKKEVNEAHRWRNLDDL
ncbi:hypothetical protein VPH35_073045 [Triticum aestivum]